MLLCDRCADHSKKKLSESFSNSHFPRYDARHAANHAETHGENMYLEKARKAGSVPTPPIITIVASPGAGKTSLGGLFPSPLFIQAESCETVFEGWAEDVQPTAFPALPKAGRDAAGNVTGSTKAELMGQLREVITAEHSFQTLVIDSVTALSRLFEHEIACRDGVGNIADAAGGFHKGYIELAAWHSEVVYACEMIRKRRGMAIVLLAHTGVQKVKNRPDEGSEYTVYGLDMHTASSQQYISNSDMVCYIKKEEFIQGAETNRKGQPTKFGRAMQTGERVLITSGDGKIGYVAAKTRYAMPVELELQMGENPLLQHIPFFNR